MKVPKSWLIAKVWKQQAEKLLWVSKLRHDIKEGLKSKYGNKKVVYDGIKFDSMGERDRYIVLNYWQRTGKIQNLVLQPRFLLAEKTGSTNALYYVADFDYIQNGERVVEDYKGHRTRVYINKVKVLLNRHKGKFRFLEVSKNWVKEFTL